VDTAFHQRMVDTRDALRDAARDVLGMEAAARRPEPPRGGIYALPEWRDVIAERHAELDKLWRDKGI